jgi:hypothetical protein
MIVLDRTNNPNPTIELSGNNSAALEEVYSSICEPFFEYTHHLQVEDLIIRL